MSILLDSVLPPLDFEPSIPGLLVTEPKTTLEQSLAHADFVRACADMDETAAYAVTHKEVLR